MKWKPGVRRLLKVRRTVTVVTLYPPGKVRAGRPNAACLDPLGVGRVTNPTHGLSRDAFLRLALRVTPDDPNVQGTFREVSVDVAGVEKTFRWIVLHKEHGPQTLRHELIHAYSFLLRGGDRPLSWKLCAFFYRVGQDRCLKLGRRLAEAVALIGQQRKPRCHWQIFTTCMFSKCIRNETNRACCGGPGSVVSLSYQ